jgi:hypothetical protein
MKKDLREHPYSSNCRAVKRFAMCSALFIASHSFSQTLTYDDFEGKKSVFYRDKSGVLDTTAKNPKPDAVNGSAHCALYVRNGTKKFDNIKMELKANLSDVSAYATYLGEPPQLKMKIYTSAPAGTLVEILLGRKSGNNDYPAGTNSQYQCYTTKSNEWEELHFLFSQVPQGSETSMTQIDQVTLLFNPNSSSSDTFYFDEITGPPMVSSSTQQIATPNDTKKKANNSKQKPNKISQK